MTSAPVRPRTPTDSVPRVVGPCSCGAPESHTERPPYGEAVQFLCPANPDLTPEQRGAAERCARRLALRREAAAQVARMDPREVALMRRQFDAAAAEAAFIVAHSRPGHLCLDCSQGI